MLDRKDLKQCLPEKMLKDLMRVVVKVWDATAADPKLLVFLKSYRNFLHIESGIKAVSHFKSGSWECKI
ncbi:hypothetical protein ABKV19_026014 [Rosa sericea]